MAFGIVLIVIGIGLVIYNNKSGSKSRLVIMGTSIDYGYFIIVIGILSLIKC